MSVHWKPTTAHDCVHCGRLVAGSCICPESSMNRTTKEPERRQEVGFWAMDHFGLMDRYKRR